MTVAQVEHDVAQCSGFVKLMCGVGNNCAYYIMMDALDHIRKHPRYTEKKISRMFEGKDNSVLGIHKRYRNRLRWPDGQRINFFKLKEMPAEIREKKYTATMTDAQYFEFWEATGTLAYTKSQQWVSSLQNKFRLSLLKHKVPCPEIAAWGLVGSSVLEMAVEIWERSMRSVHDAIPVLPKSMIDKIYMPFNIQEVANQWHKALSTLSPEINGYKLDSTEEQNITHGLDQLRELWISPDLPFDATIAAVEDYTGEIFRTKGEAKKSIRELCKMRANAIADIEQQKREMKKQEK